MTLSPKHIIKVVVSAAWIGAVAWYFFLHFPIIHLFELLADGLVAGFLCMTMTAVGRFVLKRLHIPWQSFWEEWCFSFGIGSAIVMALMIGLAASQLLYEVLIVVVMFILAGIAYADAKYFCLELYRRLATFRHQNWVWPEIVLFALMGSALIWMLLAAAAPPFFFDALSYHLAVPDQYLVQHGFYPLPYHYSSGFPANLGMLFIVGLSFSRNLLVQFLTWVYAPLSILALYAFARPRWGRLTALTAAALLLFTPSVMIISTLTSVDVAVIFYSFLSLYALLRWVETSQRHWFLLAGVLCGVTIGVKYTTLALAIPTLELLIALHTLWGQRRSFETAFRRCLVFGLIVLLCTSPWFIKNWIYTGNPLHPFFDAWFQTDAVAFNQYSQVMQRVGNPLHTWYAELRNGRLTDLSHWLNGLLILVTNPWKMTMTVSGAAGKTGVIFLMSLPALLFVSKKDRIVRYLFITAISIWGLWAFTLPWIHRYGMPLFPSLVLIVAYAIGHFSRTRWSRRVIYSVLSLFFCYHFYLFFFEMITVLKPFPYLFGNQSKEQFLTEHDVEYYAVIAWANRTLPAGSKILFEGELRGYYCQHAYINHVGIDGIAEEQMILSNLIKTSGNITELLQKLRALDITHLLINSREMERLARKYLRREAYFSFTTAKDQQLFRELFTPQYLRPLRSENGVTLNAILYPSGI